MLARKKAGLDYVRFKDLRAQLSQYGEKAGVPQSTLSASYGHTGQATIRLYQSHQSQITAEQVASIQAKMGL